MAGVTASSCSALSLILVWVQIELIEPIGEPSTWKEHLDQNRQTVHHLAFIVPDIDKAVQFLGDQGMAVD
jgi:methylmalonyl-CoA/ethylmalonyl-CoA epimerase